ncbi:hypothetical protein PL373_17370 [Tenacibaculum maritimum]|nr:hypothetical protein [Tenacibaculum maritimum]MDB0611380.1 hypothetical protein [Tenacibaculum maritimum]
MKKQLLITGSIGILGAIIMYVGDMLLYYTSTPFIFTDYIIFEIMSTVSKERLIAGGILGPLCSIMYIIGYYPIYISIRLTSKKGALIIVGLLTSSIIFGGAFHSHFPYLGMISRYENTELLNVSQEYLMIMLSVTLILNFLGYGILTYYILCKRTVYPRWMVLCSPLVLVFFGNLLHRLPYPFNLLISGGWNNIVAGVFFLLSTLILIRSMKDTDKKTSFK